MSEETGQTDTLPVTTTPEATATQSEQPKQESPAEGGAADTPASDASATETADQPERGGRAEQRIKELKRQNYEKDEEIRRLREQTTSTAPKPLDKEPNIEDYTDINQFYRDLSRWDRQEEKRLEESTRQQEKEREEMLAFDSREEDFRLKVDDYDAVVDATPFNPAMKAAIFASEVGPRIAYHLGKNPELALRLARDPNPFRVAAEIGKLEAKLTAAPPPAKVVTSAPAPVSPVGRNEVLTPDPEKMSQGDYEAWRLANRKG